MVIYPLEDLGRGAGLRTGVAAHGAPTAPADTTTRQSWRGKPLAGLFSLWAEGRPSSFALRSLKFTFVARPSPGAQPG